MQSANSYIDWCDGELGAFGAILAAIELQRLAGIGGRFGTAEDGRQLKLDRNQCERIWNDF